MFDINEYIDDVGGIEAAAIRRSWPHGFDDAFLGIAFVGDSMRVAAFDMDACLARLEADGMSLLEAQDYFGKNVLANNLRESAPVYVKLYTSDETPSRHNKGADMPEVEAPRDEYEQEHDNPKWIARNLWEGWDNLSETRPSNRPQIEPETVWRYADLSYANLRYMDLSNCDFAYANLEGADLTGATLTGANFAYANLRGAKFAPPKDDNSPLYPLGL